MEKTTEEREERWLELRPEEGRNWNEETKKWTEEVFQDMSKEREN